MPRPNLRVESGQVAMSFVEIAQALGYRDPQNRGKKAVCMCYRNAIKKLRARPEMFRQILELAAAKDASRQQENCHDD